MARSKSYKKFLKCHERAVDMIRRHWEFWRNNNEEWEDANDDLFRAGIVLSVSAMDAYYTDRFCEAFIPFIEKNGLNKNLEELICKAGFDTESAITMFDSKRPKRVLSNMVKRHLSTFVTQNFKAVDGLYKCLGFNDSFTKAAQGISRRKNLLVSLNKIIERRHKIVHAGDYNQHGNLNGINYNRLVKKLLSLENWLSLVISFLKLEKSNKLIQRSFQRWRGFCKKTAKAAPSLKAPDEGVIH